MHVSASELDAMRADLVIFFLFFVPTVIYREADRTFGYTSIMFFCENAKYKGT